MRKKGSPTRQDHEVQAAKSKIRSAAPADRTGLGIELVHEVDDVKEAAAGPLRIQARAMETARWTCRSRATVKQHVALLLDEVSAGEVPHQRLVERRVLEVDSSISVGERSLAW